VAVGAKYHHERFDGKGYPVGLKGEEIPFIARIIAVADSYDAMTSQRSYRSALPQGVVREEIERCSGTQFDPRVARLMLEIIDEDRNYELRDHTGEDVANG
jgi:HD-GYP domain-containing protein (c-di-GMP phosphodiesterase class II)